MKTNQPAVASLSIEELDAPPSMECIITMLHGDHFWHGYIQRILAAAGFETHRLEREAEHPLWQLWLSRTTCDLAEDDNTARRKILFLLNRGSLHLEREDFNILHRSGDKLRCAFTLELGAPGVLEP